MTSSPDMRPASRRSETAAVRDLVHAGAVITLRTMGVQVAVTFVRRLDGRRWFFWAEGGETEFDGHAFDADSIRVRPAGERESRVEFLNNGTLVATLEPVRIAISDTNRAAHIAGAIAEYQRRYGPNTRRHRFVCAQFRIHRNGAG